MNIATKQLYASSSNLAYMFTIMRGWTLLILEVRGQRSRSYIHLYGNNLVDIIETSSSNLAVMLAIVRRWTLLILEIRGQRSQLTSIEISLYTQ